MEHNHQGALKTKLKNYKKSDPEQGEIDIPLVKSDDHYCAECNKSFSSGKALGGHTSVAHVQASKDYYGKLKIEKSVKSKNPRSDFDASWPRKLCCRVCQKEFQSVKSVYGHMKCHPERGWRGVEPPVVARLKTSPRSKSDSDSDYEDGDDNDSSQHEAGYQVDSASMATSAEINLVEALSGYGWGVTRKRGQVGVTPHVVPPRNPAPSSLGDPEMVDIPSLVMRLRKSCGQPPMVGFKAMGSNSLASRSVGGVSKSRTSLTDAKTKDRPFSKIRQLGKPLASKDHSFDGELSKMKLFDDEISEIKPSYNLKKSYELSEDKAKGKKVITGENKKECMNTVSKVRVSKLKRSRTYAEIMDGPSPKKRKIAKGWASEDKNSDEGASAEVLEKALVLSQTGFDEKVSSDDEVHVETTYDCKDNHKPSKSAAKGKNVIMADNKKKGNKILPPDADDDTDYRSNASISVTQKIYKCPHCDNVFSCYESFGGHMSAHIKPEINYVIPSISQAKETEKRHQCKICNQIFLSGQALGGHQRSHSNGSSNKAASSEDHHANPTRKVLDFDLNEYPDMEAKDIAAFWNSAWPRENSYPGRG